MQKKLTGFHNYNLNNDEKELLRAFNHYGELIHPHESLNYIEIPNINNALNNLRKKQLVYGDRPIRLTTKGRLIKESLEAY